MKKLVILFLLLVITESVQARNVWVDTDLACGNSRTTDVDDCLALTYLFNRKDINIVGVSTVFGNASEEIVFERLKEFLNIYQRSYPNFKAPPVFRGAKKRKNRYANAPRTEASKEIEKFFRSNQGELYLLGPSTNLAAVIEKNSDVIRNIHKILFIAGKKDEGRRFFPNGKSILLSFRDFNFHKDKYSFKTVLASNTNLHLAGYDLATQELFNSKSLENLGINKPLGPYLKKNIQGWERYWKESFSLSGFYPFDLSAVRSILNPEKYNCYSTKLKLHAFNFFFFEILKSLQVGFGNRDITFCDKNH